MTGFLRFVAALVVVSVASGILAVAFGAGLGMGFPNLAQSTSGVIAAALGLLVAIILGYGVVDA